jgi:hypothetical protein
LSPAAPAFTAGTIFHGIGEQITEYREGISLLIAGIVEEILMFGRLIHTPTGALGQKIPLAHHLAIVIGVIFMSGPAPIPM